MASGMLCCLHGSLLYCACFFCSEALDFFVGLFPLHGGRSDGLEFVTDLSLQLLNAFVQRLQLGFAVVEVDVLALCSFASGGDLEIDWLRLPPCLGPLVF